MFDLIASVLAFFYDQWPSYGMAVVFLTLAVMVVATPLTLKSTKSMLQMQRLQPELKAIQTKYKDDRPKMNEELMAFYQENGINPLGWLPAALLVQLPIFLVLFRVVQGITRRTTAGRRPVRLDWAARSRVCAPRPSVRSTAFDSGDQDVRSRETCPKTARCSRISRRETEMISWGMDLSRNGAGRSVSDNLVTAIPYLDPDRDRVGVEPLPAASDPRAEAQAAEVNPQQQMIMKILPFMLPVFSFTMPAALVVYFVVSNLYRIGQQGYITQIALQG